MYELLAAPAGGRGLGRRGDWAGAHVRRCRRLRRSVLAADSTEIRLALHRRHPPLPAALPSRRSGTSSGIRGSPPAGLDPPLPCAPPARRGGRGIWAAGLGTQGLRRWPETRRRGRLNGCEPDDRPAGPSAWLVPPRASCFDPSEHHDSPHAVPNGQGFNLEWTSAPKVCIYFQL